MHRLISIVSCLSATCVLAAPHDQPVVKRDSEVVREIYRQPLTADPAPLLIAREILKLADDGAVSALDAHLARMGFAILAGAPVPEGGTIGELMDPAKARAPASREAISRILDTSLRAKLERVDSKSKHLFASIGNAGSRAFRLYESKLTLLDGRDVITLDCNPVSPTWRPLEPGAEGRPYDCGVAGNMYGLEGYFDEFAKANPPGTELPIKAQRIEFEDPPLALSSQGASWQDRNQGAFSVAYLRLKETSCDKRGACADAVWRHLTDRPHYLAALVGAVLGIVSGAVIAFTARRRRRVAGIVAIVGVAGGMGFGIIGGTAMGGSMGAWIMGFLALVGSVAFLIALVISVSAFGAFRRAPV